jgi:chorismate synthase
MAGNSFGDIFNVITFGESHGAAVGCVVDGCPAGLALDTAMIQRDLARRRPGGGGAATTRAEADEPEILSGVFQGRTLGTPIAIIIRNTQQKSDDYDALRDIFRPGHADWTFEAKYGARDHRGGGRSSGRETAGRVAAGAIARALLAENGIAIHAWTSEIADIPAPPFDSENFDATEAERNPLRIPNKEIAAKIEEKIATLRQEGDSSGGIVSCRIDGIPPGLGEPVFNKLDALLAHAMLSIGAAKGFEIGSGFASARLRGSENNDRPLRSPTQEGEGAGAPVSPLARTLLRATPLSGALPRNAPPQSFETNHAGGVLGGISCGMPVEFRVAFKPVPSIAQKQQTIDRQGRVQELKIGGRHDICVCPRSVPVVEAMAAIVLADLLLQNGASRACASCFALQNSGLHGGVAGGDPRRGGSGRPNEVQGGSEGETSPP